MARLQPSHRHALIALAIATALLQLAHADGYGYFRDELYYLACGQHLAWGYVDHPPLIAALARLAGDLFGDSLVGLRLLPALAAGGTVALTGVLVRQLGGGAWAIAAAGVCAALAPCLLFTGHVLTMNAFEPLFWLGSACLLLRLQRTGDARLWAAMGAIIGVGLLNKHSMIFFAAALAAGLALTPGRRLFASRWLAVGAAVATLVVLPHVLWQVSHGLPQLEMLRSAAATKNAPFALTRFLGDQLVLMHPLYAPLGLWGLAWLLFAPAARPGRPLGLGFVALLGIFALLEAKAYYLAPAHPILFAAGGCALEAALRPRWARALVVALLLAGGAALAPLSLPVLPVDRLVAYQAALGLTPPASERHRQGRLPQHVADQHGWPEMVEAIARVHAALPPAERERAVIFVHNYGEAGAIDWLGRAHGLPPARSGHNTYFLWGPGPIEPAVLLILGGDADDHAQVCATLEVAGRLPPHPDVMPYEDQLPIYRCRGLVRPLAELWPAVKHYR